METSNNIKNLNIDNNNTNNSINTNTNQEQKKEKEKLPYIYIDTITKCVKVVEEILLKETVVAIDCEGVYLSKEGRLMLIQVKLYKI
jgi:hypothetical protein